MRASIIVVAYNSRADLGPCLGAITAQMQPDDELIVVDNASTDGSAEWVQAQFPEARLLRCTNLGYAGGNNVGAAAARGEFLVILNPDTMLEAGALDALLAPLHNDPTALTTARIVFMDRPTIINTCGNTMHYTGLAYCRGAGRPLHEFEAPAEVDAVSGAAFAIPRQCFVQLGGFDEHFWMYVEDTDLSLRAQMRGSRIIYVPQAIVRHAYTPAYSPRKAFFLDRNRHLMLLKNMSWGMYARMLPALLLSEFVTWGFLALQGPRYWPVKLRVYHALWHMRPHIRAARRAAQAQRRRPEREVVARMTHRLEFHQFAHGVLARAAALVLHPAFRAARWVCVPEPLGGSRG